MKLSSLKDLKTIFELIGLEISKKFEFKNSLIIIKI